MKNINLPGDPKLFGLWKALSSKIVQVGKAIDGLGAVAQNEMEISMEDVKQFKTDVNIFKNELIDLSAKIELLFDKSVDYIKSNIKK